MNHGAFTAWRSRGIPVLPPRRNLLLLAKALRVDYEYLVEVILHDTEYLPGSVALEREVETRRYNSRGNPKVEVTRPNLVVASALGEGSDPTEDPLSEVASSLPAAAESGELEGPGEDSI